MNNDSAIPESAQRHDFPKRINVVNVAHPSLDRIDLELAPAEFDGESIPTASYVLEAVGSGDSTAI